MNDPVLNFSREEFAERLTLTRSAMSAAGVDVIVVSDPSNMAWLTGYDGWSFYVHQAVVLPLEGSPVWWGRGIDANGARRTTYLDDTDIIGYDDNYVQNPERHPMLNLAENIAERGWANARIGVELDNYYYSAAAHGCLFSSLPEAQLLDATGLVNWQRKIKSKTEIDYMRRAARIVEAMHRTIVDTAEVGMPKNELVAEIYRTSIRGADGHWGDYPALVPMAPSGMDATAAHLTWDDKPLERGVSTFFEIAGVHRRYHAPQSRTLILGEPPKKYLDAEKAVLEATDAALKVAEPGRLCEDIANAFNSMLNKFGFEKDNRCGYSIGLSYPPDWGERTMSFRRGDKSALEPGMVFHFMPALWLDDGGLEITEPILITDDGHECLCQTARQLFVKR